MLMQTNAGMLHFLFLSCLRGSFSCHLGSRLECETARFVPGYNLAGEGFDVVTHLRKGAYVVDVSTDLTADNTCRLCENRLQGDQVQKLPVSALDWRVSRLCRHKLTSELHHSVGSLVHSYTSSNHYNWGVSFSLDEKVKASVEGSRSRVADFASSQARIDKTSFVINDISCVYYSYRLSNRPPITTEFDKQLQTLPPQYDDNTKFTYRQMIETFGTHYIHHVQLGGRIRRVTAFNTCLAALGGASESQVKDSLTAGLNIALGKVSSKWDYGQTMNSILKKSTALGFSQEFMLHDTEIVGGEDYHPENGGYQNPSTAYTSWINSLRHHPEVVSYSLTPLYLLARNPAVRANLRSALDEYIQENKPPKEPRHGETCPSSNNQDYNCCPYNPGYGILKVTVLSAGNIDGDFANPPDGYVKLWYRNVYRQTHFVKDNSNPVWGTVFNFGLVDLTGDMKFEVWDKDLFFDDHLGTCWDQAEQGSHTKSCSLRKGYFTYQYTVECDVHLTGRKCHQYAPVAAKAV